MMFNDLLFELGTEELPSSLVRPLVEALSTHLVTALKNANIKHGQVFPYATPRRLALIIKDVETLQPSQHMSRRGPSMAMALDENGKPLPALVGFAKSCKVDIKDLSTIKTDKGEWWIYEAEQPGAQTKELLPGMLKEAIAGLPIKKPMRWGNGEFLFARPVHWVLLLFGQEVVDCELFGLKTGRETYGHRFHHPQALTISSPSEYVSLLKEAFVVADDALRRQMIAEQVTTLAALHGYEPIMPDMLLDEVTFIVEWPKALFANFEKKFLNVPSEALIAAMQHHQRYFALQNKEGQLVPHFITVANIFSTNEEQVIRGNEKVIRARLSDADFFYRQDQKKRLSEYREATAQVIFQEKLGSLQAKMERISDLMDYLIEPLQLIKTEAKRAAFLSKCDLMTGMVSEFPELEGVMGYYYACKDGESIAVASALKEQYLPRFAKDELPASSLGIALAIADRLDTLVGIFAIGQRPTGVKDPFKLRRQALAIVRLLMTVPAPLSLSNFIDIALGLYAKTIKPGAEVAGELKRFILERLQSYYQSENIPQHYVESVRACQDDWLFDLDKRIHALKVFADFKEASHLSSLCKRVNNLIQQAGMPADADVDSNLIQESAEKTLLTEMQRVEKTLTTLLQNGDYEAILQQLAMLHGPVDAFFEQVMVMVEDKAIKENRLRLLKRLQRLLQSVADISLL